MKKNRTIAVNENNLLYRAAGLPPKGKVWPLEPTLLTIQLSGAVIMAWTQGEIITRDDVLQSFPPENENLLRRYWPIALTIAQLTAIMTGLQIPRGALGSFEQQAEIRNVRD